MASGSSAEYIKHHLTNLTYGKLPAGYARVDAHGHQHVLEEATWTLAHSGDEASAMGFSALHVDTLGWSIILGLVFCAIFRGVAKESQ